jgi:peptidoglycan/LPS O-acetylase OafA/YrhL
MTNKKRFLLLDGVRGLAAIGVMSLHFWFGNSVFSNPLASLVDPFFVLSGFVLMPSLAASEKERFSFFKKRLLRFYSVLIPAFLIFVFFQYVDFQGGTFTLTNYSIIQIVGAFFFCKCSTLNVFGFLVCFGVYPLSY